MKKLNFFKKAIFVFLTIIFLFLILEISFRIMYSLKYRKPLYLTYGLTNILKFNVREFKGYFKFDDYDNKITCLVEGDVIYLGMRTAPFPIKKPKEEYRIIALGGSSTFAVIGGYKESWPYLLEKKLNREYDEKKYRVINAGIGSQTTYGVSNLLKNEGFNWNPDLVILYSLYNHACLDEPVVYKGGPLVDRLFRQLKGLFYTKSLLAAYLINYIGLRSEFALQNKMETYRYLLNDMVEECKQRNVDILIVKQLVDPVRFFKSNLTSTTRDGDNYDPSQYSEFLKVIDEIAEKHKDDCYVIDFSTYSPLCREKLDKLLIDYVHLTAGGKELLAQRIYKLIKDEIG